MKTILNTDRLNRLPGRIPPRWPDDFSPPPAPCTDVRTAQPSGVHAPKFFALDQLEHFLAWFEERDSLLRNVDPLSRFGFRAMRPRRFRARKLPNPRNSTLSPRLKASVMHPSTVSTIYSASRREISMTRASSIRSALVIRSPCRPLPELYGLDDFLVGLSQLAVLIFRSDEDHIEQPFGGFAC